MTEKTQKIQEALTRGVENIYPNREGLEKILNSGKKLKIFNGIDPTGPSLHLGHVVVLLKLKQLQDLGHQIIILIGDFTAQIGDPTDKLAARKPLTHKQVLQNARDYKKQIGKILDLKKTVFKYNSKWLSKLSFTDFLQLSAHFTAQQTLQREMFKQRLNQGKDLYLHEFFYPLMQAYDSVAMDVDMEIGGNDQTFNMLAGRTLMRKMKNKEKFVLTTKLLVDPEGAKMGKTAGNMAALNDKPEEIYGKVMSWPDEMIVPAFELCTQVPSSAVNQVAQEYKSGKNPKILKMFLAYKIIEMYFGKQAAIAAEEYFKQVFEEGLNPDKMPVFKMKKGSLVDILVKTKLAASKSEARRLILQGGIKVDTLKVTDENHRIEKIDADGVVIQKGKRHFVKIVN